MQVLDTPKKLLWALLQTEDGWALWRHRVAFIGPRGSVWAYNRFADAVRHSGRVLLAIMLLYYVDDFGAVDSVETAGSGFESFERLSEFLRIKLKQRKKQPSCAEREVLGIAPRQPKPKP